MAWQYLDLITLNKQGNWEFSSPFPKTCQAIKFIETLTIQGTNVPPENTNIRGLMTIGQHNSNGILEIIKNTLIYPSDIEIIYSIPLHPFTNPKVGLKLLKNIYDKYEPSWRFQIYYWDEIIMIPSNQNWELIIQ